MKRKREGFRPADYLIFTAATAAMLLLCVCAGSVSVPAGDTLRCLWQSIAHRLLGAAEPEAGLAAAIILPVQIGRSHV